jgi:hypothetical protein
MSLSSLILEYRSYASSTIKHLEWHHLKAFLISADLALVRLTLLFSPSVLLLIFSSFLGAAQGHATSFSPCFGSPLVSVHAPNSGPAAR